MNHSWPTWRLRDLYIRCIYLVSYCYNVKFFRVPSLHEHPPPPLVRPINLKIWSISLLYKIVSLISSLRIKYLFRPKFYCTSYTNRPICSSRDVCIPHRTPTVCHHSDVLCLLWPSLRRPSRPRVFPRLLRKESGLGISSSIRNLLQLEKNIYKFVKYKPPY